MDLKYIFIILTLFVCSNCTNEPKGSQGNDFTDSINNEENAIANDSSLLTFFKEKRHPLTPVYTPLPTGSNRPKGWLLEMMQQDLRQGIVGALDELYPGITSFRNQLYRWY